jgi:HSP20 family protein
MKHNCQSGVALMRDRQHGALVTPINELFDAFFGAGIGQAVGSDEIRGITPRVNIIDSPGAFTLQLLAPGFAKDELTVKVENNMLVIKADSKTSTLKENERWNRREFGRNALRRSFRLPEGIQTEAISAEHVDGILTVTLPKHEEAKPKAFSVSIG